MTWILRKIKRKKKVVRHHTKEILGYYCSNSLEVAFLIGNKAKGLFLL